MARRFYSTTDAKFDPWTWETPDRSHRTLRVGDTISVSHPSEEQTRVWEVERVLRSRPPKVVVKLAENQGIYGDNPQPQGLMVY